MKNSIMLALFLLFFNLSSFSQFKSYHSIAEINSNLRATYTTLELVKWTEGKERDFGVLIAQDISSLSQNKTYYILLAPCEVRTSLEIDNLILDYSAPLKEEELAYFIKELELRISEWGKNKDGSQGTFFEIVTAPEYKINKISENVDLWSPTIKFGYQDTPDGTISILYIGPESYKYSYEFDNKKELEAFYTVLKNAKDKIKQLKNNDK